MSWHGLSWHGRTEQADSSCIFATLSYPQTAILLLHSNWLGSCIRAVSCLPQIAVSLNYNKVYGWIDFDSISPDYISKNFDAEWKKQASKYPMDLPNMKKLYEAVDVIGLSGGCGPVHEE